jgi:hypothetical protein
MMERKSVAFILAFAIVASVVAVTVNAQPIVKEIPTFIYTFN